MAIHIPKPLYSCSECHDECTWPAEDLFWSETLNGWCCENCWEDAHWNESNEQIEYGISLAKELKRRGLNR